MTSRRDYNLLHFTSCFILAEFMHCCLFFLPLFFFPPFLFITCCQLSNQPLQHLHTWFSPPPFQSFGLAHQWTLLLFRPCMAFASSFCKFYQSLCYLGYAYCSAAEIGQPNFVTLFAFCKYTLKPCLSLHFWLFVILFCVLVVLKAE